MASKTFSPYHPKKELVVGLGVEEPPAYTTAMREAFFNKCPNLNGRPYFLFISRIHEKKGVDLLLNAYNKIYGPEGLKNVPVQETGDASFTGNNSVSANLVVAGPGLETVYGQIIQASALKTPQAGTNIHFPGMLTGDAKWGAFYACEAFVLPSHQENFGIAVVEALACGKPVLISNQVNIYTEIASSKAGIIADDTAAGTQGLLEKWNQLSKDQKIEMGKNARNCYEKHFAVSPAAHQFLKGVMA